VITRANPLWGQDTFLLYGLNSLRAHTSTNRACSLFLIGQICCFAQTLRRGSGSSTSQADR
jgi:hypothetical protein